MTIPASNLSKLYFIIKVRPDDLCVTVNFRETIKPDMKWPRALSTVNISPFWGYWKRASACECDFVFASKIFAN